MITIGIDLLGSDIPSQEILNSISSILEATQDCRFVLIGDSSVSKPNNCTLVTADSCIEMHEEPLKAIRTKKSSSMAIGVEMLAQKKIDVLISCGNTGALLALSKLKLPLMPGITKPAFLAILPKKEGMLAVLDVGANINFTASLLIGHARMGSAYVQALGIKTPKVALLNIGKEPLKGPPALQEAYEKLQTSQEGFQFIGNIEPRDVFTSDINVLVCDGFSGNIFLKTAEGISERILEELEIENLPEAFKKKFSYDEYPGAMLCGLEGLVIKCHGNAKPLSIAHSIKQAKVLIENNFLRTLKQHLVD